VWRGKRAGEWRGDQPGSDDRQAQIAELRSLFDEGRLRAADYEQRRRTILAPRKEAPGDWGKVVVDYRTGRIVFGSVLFFGMGAFFAWIIGDPLNDGNGVRVIEAVFACFFFVVGGLVLLGLIRTRRGRKPAIAIDNECIECGFLNGRRFRIPWSEVSGVRERVRSGQYADTKWVALDLRQPLAQFTVQRPSCRGSVAANLVLRSLSTDWTLRRTALSG
jgi:hypothetical protein